MMRLINKSFSIFLNSKAESYHRIRKK